MFYKKKLIIGESLRNIKGLEPGTELKRVIFKDKEYIIGFLKQNSVIEAINYNIMLLALLEHQEGIINNKKDQETNILYFVYDINNNFISSLIDINSVPEPTQEIIIEPELEFSINTIIITNKEKVNEAAVHINVRNGFDMPMELPLNYIKEINIDNQFISYNNGILNIDYNNLIDELEDASVVINTDQKIINAEYKVVIDNKEYLVNQLIIVQFDNIERNKEMMIEKDNELTANMMASVDMFELLMNMMPITISDEIDYTPFINIINVYVNLINKGKKNKEDVPLFIRNKVEELL